MEKISLVVPCYNEKEVLPLFYEEVSRVMASLPEYAFEMICVDDGSQDNTLEVLKELAAKDPRVKYLSFSRNFGKEAALYAGLSHAGGEYVAILDADLQDPPALLVDMLPHLKEGGYDCVAARRGTRKGEPVIRSFFSRLFYRVINRISNTEIVDGARDFRLMHRSVVDAIVQMPEYNRFTKGIYGWVGFKTKWVTYENIERAAGQTKWSFWRLFLYSLEGIFAFSTAPLAIASIVGLIFFLISGVAILVIVFKTLVWGDPVQGFPALACFVFLVGGIQLFCIGIMGQYLAKAYMETKRRPIYLVREKNCDTGEGLAEGNDV
ncbi:MAG: glycosyltransferase family 2 protein [Peptococcaceae bacterium]|nr:glycosyltransferase family 2 protein [Peptococcaceae bacterium]